MMKMYKKEFLEILNSYQGIIHKINLIYFPAPEDRKDNFQDVVFQMWKAFPALKDKAKIASWIYSIAINTSISRIRKDSRYVRPGDMESSRSLTADDSTGADLDFQRLLAAIRQLKEIDRSIMTLYIEEYSYNEIAEIIGITGSNVGARIARAKKQLEKLLK